MINTLSLLFNLSLAESFSPWLLIIFYITGIDLLWGVNIIFLGMTGLLLYDLGPSIRLYWFSRFFLFFLIISFLKFFFFFDQETPFEFKHLLSYFFGLIVPFLALSYTNKYNSKNRSYVYSILTRYSCRFTLISSLAIITYSIFYFTGRISYFGLGANWHYAYPFLLTSLKGSTSVWFFFIVIISGKRASILNYLTQTFAYYISLLRSKPIVPAVFLSLFILLISYLLQNTPLLDRFRLFFDNGSSLVDHRVLISALGGRYEELQGIYQYLMTHPFQVFFGSPPGASYFWEVNQGQYYLATKNYAHVTIFGYIFRYGIVFAFYLYGIFLRILIKCWDPHNPLYIVFIGIFSSSFFGANLIVDPISWVFIGLLISLQRVY